MAEQVKSFIRKTITPLASFVLFDVLNVNYFLGYLGLALETIEEDQQQENLELETKRKIEAEEVRQRKKIKPSEDLANIESEEARDEEEERPGSRQKLWNLKPEINFTESLQMKVNFSGPKKYIAPTESFEGDILKDVNDVDAEEAMGTVSDVVFVSNVDVVNNPYHFESVTQYVVIPNPSEASLQSDVKREEASSEVSAIEDDVMKNEIEAKPAPLPRLVDSNPDIEAVASNPSGNPNPILNEDEPVREVESNKHDDDTVLITTQDLTKLVKDNYSVDDSQDDAILITTQDLDAILNDGIKSNEGESEASVIAQAEENSKDEITETDSNVNPDIEGIMDIGISSKETSDAIIDAGNKNILNINRKQSEIVDVESDENEETPEDQDVEDVPHGITDPNGSVESAGSLEVGMEAGEDAFVVIDEASDLLTDKTNMIIPKSPGKSDDKTQVISVAGDKENKTEGKKKSSGGRKGKNKKKVF